MAPSVHWGRPRTRHRPTRHCRGGSRRSTNSSIPSPTRSAIGTTVVAAGTPVTLRPSRRADAHDMFLAGMDATVSGIFQDVDGDALVAVTLDDDPATEALVWQGRYLFFHPDEIEVRT